MKYKVCKTVVVLSLSKSEFNKLTLVCAEFQESVEQGGDSNVQSYRREMDLTAKIKRINPEAPTHTHLRRAL